VWAQAAQAELSDGEVERLRTALQERHETAGDGLTVDRRMARLLRMARLTKTAAAGIGSIESLAAFAEGNYLDALSEPDNVRELLPQSIEPTPTLNRMQWQ
jgi:hypothetical protein